MNCSIIMDLLPLYADGCCCEDSKALVEKHLKDCKDCKKALSDMKDGFGEAVSLTPPAKIGRISQFRASLLQSLLLFLSFAAVTLGVTFEAATPMGDKNGNWAFMLIIPATAFLLSLANWYFVRLYKSRGLFSTCSCLITAGFALCGFAWAVLHYVNFSSFYLAFGVGVGVTVVLCTLSKILSSIYAQALGKD